MVGSANKRMKRQGGRVQGKPSMGEATVWAVNELSDWQVMTALPCTPLYRPPTSCICLAFITSRDSFCLWSASPSLSSPPLRPPVSALDVC